jgi:pimeloyl-ACP methyl ester carboxylesterase
METPKRKRKLWWILLIPLALIACVIAVFLGWALTPAGPMAEAQPYLQSDDVVEVVPGGWVTFRPKGEIPDTGLILYPGARVDPRSYAPAAYEIAKVGYLVVIPSTTLNLAVFSPDVADEVIARYPNVQHWVIAGHSLGGTMAAQYADTHPDAVEALVLWAAYPPSANDLSDSDLKTLSIYGTRDMDVETIESRKSMLPPDTTWVVIDGGNHGQFGWYGSQPGDNDATITRAEQQRQIVEATIAFLDSLSAAAD